MLDDYSSGMKPIGDNGGIFSSTDLEGFLDLYSTRQNNLYDRTNELEAQLADIDRKIGELEKAMYLEKEEQSSTSVSVILLAREQGDAELILSYSTSLLKHCVLFASHSLSFQWYLEPGGQVCTTSEPNSLVGLKKARHRRLCSLPIVRISNRQLGKTGLESPSPSALPYHVPTPPFQDSVSATFVPLLTKNASRANLDLVS